MPGGASLRRFFRVRFSDGHSAVGMFFPDATGAEEVTNQTETPSEWPFVEVQRLLQSRNVDVPALLGQDAEAGWLLVEDLGDLTLAECLVSAAERKTELYQRAVADLARAQRSLSELPPTSIVSQRRFDVELLHWEIDHFRQYGLQARGITLSDTQQRRFDGAAVEVAQAIANLPYGFVHRDYQSRNLMVVPSPNGERLAWVDFQDALLGPRAYDLVALLSDSYQTFDDAFIEQRLAEYVHQRGLSPSELPQVQREFDLITVQRKLKDAGRFVFIQHKKGDDSYLRFIEPSLEKVRNAMGRLQDVPAVRELESLLDELLG